MSTATHTGRTKASASRSAVVSSVSMKSSVTLGLALLLTIDSLPLPTGLTTG